jgi:CDP-glucose 4,6-dehydratase
VSEAARTPISTLQNNIVSTLNMLETARINNIPRVVIASSDKSYGDHDKIHDPERVPYHENHALRGLDVYSTSKVCADMISQAYALQFGLKVLVVRSCNVYGPGDLNCTRLIPRTILRLLVRQEPIIHQGNDRVLREYIYIDDAVEAYRFLAENIDKHYQDEMPRSGRATYGWSAYNVGSYTFDPPRYVEDCPNIRSAREVIQAITTKLHMEHLRPQIMSKHESFIEIPDQYLDSGKLMKLGFQAKVPFDEGLDRTINWYAANRDYLCRFGNKYLN